MSEEERRAQIEDGWNCDRKELLPEDLSPLDGLAFYSSFHRTRRQKLVYDNVFVSSPNTDWCPSLQSLDAIVCLRADGTFGPDDPVCWPQLYHADAPHLPCIPILDPDENSPTYVFRRGLRWEQVTLTDDWEENHRVCRLSDDLVHKLNSCINPFLKEAQDFLSVTGNNHPRLHGLLQCLKSVLPKISEKKDPLFRLRIVFGLVSRLYLEARGYLDYHTKYRPLLKSGGKPVVNHDLVGVWTEDKDVCRDYWQMGIPVWYIRTRAQVSSATQKFVKHTKPRLYQSRPLWPFDSFRDDGISRKEPAVHKGQTDMGNFLKVVDAWLKPKLQDLFNDSLRKKRRLEQEDGEIREPVGRVLINKHIETNNVQNDKLRAMFEPEPTKAWVEAAAVYAKISLEGTQHQPRFVPQVDLITGVSSGYKAKEFVAVWKLIRHRWLYEVFMNRKPPEFVTRKAWKSFAVSAFSQPEIINPNNETSIARIRFTEFMHFPKIISLPRESFTFSKGDVPGTIDEKVSTEMVRDTVRELVDLNFFFDMFEVEYYRTYDPPAEIVERMRPVMSPFSLTYPQHIPRSTLAERAAWLGRVRNFITPWQGKKPKYFSIKLSDIPTDGEVTVLEAAVADVYCSNVTYVLRRRPVLPRYK